MNFELNIIKWFQEIANDFTDILGEGITILGEQVIIVAIVAFIYFVYNKKAGEYIAYSVFLSACINGAIKGLVRAPRPFQVDNSIVGKRAQTATGFSFPSGHTQAAASFYTAIGKIFKNKKIWIVIGIIIFLVGVSRIYLGVHFPRDVIVGAALGVGSAILGFYLFNLVYENPKRKFLLFFVTGLIFFPFLFVFYEENYVDIEMYRDFYITYALYFGFGTAIYIENKFVNFTCDCKLNKRIIRFIVAVILFLCLQLGLKYILPNENIFFDMLRYFLTAFIPLGIFPLTFKRFNLN
ncbi:MAG TPA: phosphatase PAP2 family protein [Acholeplasmataceae bacterium]|nr:phosphatase PAP2 family protein [Acholeplasmataceae bacterium]